MIANAAQIAVKLLPAALDMLGDLGQPSPRSCVMVEDLMREAKSPEGQFEAYSVALSAFSLQPRTEAVWMSYAAMFDADRELVVRAGLLSLELNKGLSAEEILLVRQMLAFTRWFLWENRRQDHNIRKTRWPTGPGSPPFEADKDAILFDPP